ncbi:hypothetical protein [Brevundimonas sp.]|uniref:hypothetical protein n=1 Tax=Brevundimonas sp. TaxID=1871086 RepID=UPI002D34644C|nr:hypothetical protein [Brevundimonas sp.]HYC68091.1 hypothetical protein [Brevundimonas sp.]
MRRALVVAVALATAFAETAGASPAVAASPQTAAAPVADDPFAGAWAEEELERAVKGPLEALDKGDITVAEQRVEQLLTAAASEPAERVRLMTAWAIALMIHADKGDPLPWLRRAAAEARTAWPADSRLRAMALSDYGTFEVEQLGAAASAEAEAALVEALEINRARLGPGHVEALATSIALGELRGQPGRTGGNPERIAEAARLFEVLLTADPVTGEDDLAPFFLDWTRMLIANGQPDAACAVLDKLPALEGRLKLNLRFIALRTGLALRDAGYARQAASLISDEIPAPGKPDPRQQCSG